MVPVDLPGLQVRCPADPHRARQPDRPATGGPARCDRRNVAAQQHRPVEPRRGGNRRWRRGHPAGHPTTVRTVPCPGHHHAAVTAQRRCRRCAARRPRIWPPTHRPDCRPRPTFRRVSRQRHGQRAPPGSRRPSRRPTVPRRRRSAPWRGRRTTPSAASRCRTPARTTPPTMLLRAQPTPGHRWRSPRARNREYEAEPAPLPWYKRPPVLFGAAAVAALLAIGGLAVTLTGDSGVAGPGHRDEHDLLASDRRRTTADIRRAARRSR